MKLYLTLILTIFMVGACQTGTSEQPTTDPKTAETPEASEPAANTALATPTDTIKSFVEGVKAKDEKAVRAALSAASLSEMDEMVKKMGKEDATLFDHPLFKEEITMPETKDEKIDGEKATLQVRDAKDKEWEPVNFVKEADGWKLDFSSGEKAEKPEPKEKEGEDKPDESKTSDKEKEVKKSGEPEAGKSFNDG